MSVYWNFAPDPENKGDKENWKNTSWAEGNSCWEAVRVDKNWEEPGRRAHPALRKLMKNYDGIGWYSLRLNVPPEWKGKDIRLLFGAVDESAWVYLNGKFCGERIYKDPDDWKNSFTIPIDRHIDWTKKSQSLVVKVRDVRGQGGIWRPVMLVCKDKK